MSTGSPKHPGHSPDSATTAIHARSRSARVTMCGSFLATPTSISGQGPASRNVRSKGRRRHRSMSAWTVPFIFRVRITNSTNGTPRTGASTSSTTSRSTISPLMKTGVPGSPSTIPRRSNAPGIDAAALGPLGHRRCQVRCFLYKSR